jgi:hypothetical protein
VLIRERWHVIARLKSDAVHPDSVVMRIARNRNILGEPGGFARGRYKELHKPWRRKVRTAFPIGIAPLIAAFAGLSLIWPSWFSFFTGVVVGAGVAMYASVVDSPPHWIAKWGRGGDGELRTHRKLRRLSRRGWVIAHDLDDPGFGNHDHVVVGPAVFVLETKTLSGELSVDGDSLIASHGDVRLDRFVNSAIGSRVRGKAVRLRNELIRSGIPDVGWVQGVVVLWGAFPARIVEGDRLVFLHGDELRHWLAGQEGGLAAPTRGLIRDFLASRVQDGTLQLEQSV